MGRKSREKREERERAEANARKDSSGGSPTPGSPTPGGNAAASEGRNLMAFWVIGIVVLLVAVGVVLFTQYADDNSKTDGAAFEAGPAFSEVEFEGESLPGYAQGSTDSAVGTAAPVVSGGKMGTEDQRMTIGGPGDEPTAILFLAHWCPHCQAEVPVLLKHFEDNGTPEGVNIVGVATLTDEGQPNFPADEWLYDEGWTFDTLLDDQIDTAAGKFGLSGTPFYVFLNADGTVYARHSGEMPLDLFDETIAGLTGGTPDGAADGSA